MGQVKIGILSNTVSKANSVHRVHDTLDNIIDRENAKDFVQHVCVGRANVEDPSFEQLVGLYTPAVRKLVEEEKVDVLAIDGGDGTAHIVYSVLMHMYKNNPRQIPAVVHMRGGTINYIADSTGVPKRSPLRWIPHQLTQIPVIGKYLLFKREHAPEYVLKQLLEKCRDLTPEDMRKYHMRKMYLLKIDDNTKANKKPKKYGLLAAFGAPYNFLEKYYDASTGRPGPYKALKIIAKGVACAAASPFSRRAREYVDSIVRKIDVAVSLDSVPSPHQQYTGLVPTSTDITLKITPLTIHLSRADEQKSTGLQKIYGNYNRIRAFGANVTIPELLWTFAKIVLPGFTVKETPNIHNRQVQEIKITPQRCTIGYSVEGNLYQTANPIRITPSEIMMPFFQF